MIRSAHMNDLGEIRFLLEDLGYSLKKEEVSDRLNYYLNTAGYGVLVKEIDGRSRGFLAWVRVEKFTTESARFWIEALVVAAAYRKKGIARELIGTLENKARLEEGSTLHLLSRKTRSEQGTHAFYHTLGFQNEGVEERTYLWKKLKP